MHTYGYIATYKGKRLELYAQSTYSAQLQAAKHFNAKKSYEVSVILAEKDGQEIIHTFA